MKPYDFDKAPPPKEIAADLIYFRDYDTLRALLEELWEYRNKDSKREDSSNVLG